MRRIQAAAPPTGKSIDALADYAKRASQAQAEIARQIGGLNTQFLKGRIRSDRAAVPSAYNSVNDKDREGDVIVSAGGIYWLVNDAGTLKWALIGNTVNFPTEAAAIGAPVTHIADVSGTPSGTDASIIADLQTAVGEIIDALEAFGIDPGA